MTSDEAGRLCNLIKWESMLTPEMRQIGNGEYVVIIRGFWLWSLEDWQAHKYHWGKNKIYEYAQT